MLSRRGSWRRFGRDREGHGAQSKLRRETSLQQYLCRDCCSPRDDRSGIITSSSMKNRRREGVNYWSVPRIPQLFWIKKSYYRYTSLNLLPRRTVGSLTSQSRWNALHLSLMRIQLRKEMLEKVENVWNCLTYEQHCFHNSRRNNLRDICNMHAWWRFLIPILYFPSMPTGASVASHSCQKMLLFRASNISVNYFVYRG